LLQPDDAKTALLKNRMSGETFAFEKGTKPSLHFSGNYAYLHLASDSSSEAKAVWATSLLKWSVWLDIESRKHFMFQRHKDGWESQWLSDISGRKITYLSLDTQLQPISLMFQILFLSFDITVALLISVHKQTCGFKTQDVNSVQNKLTVYTFATPVPNTGCCLFWQVETFLQAVGSKCDPRSVKKKHIELGQKIGSK
jgi:hypothetical protein